MGPRRQTTLLRQIIALTGQRGEADAELLRRYAEGRDEAAFAELHRRHGPLVWAACRHLLTNPADAEDAYQVTFLALVKAAGQVRNGAAVGAWLHGVAVRTAARLKRSAARRRTREERAAASEADQTVTEAAWTGLLAAVHEEIERLPAELRTAFVLCDLQGVRQPDAAARLGWKAGTLTGRLAKARQQLTARLKERGITPALAAGVCGVAVTAAGAALRPEHLAATVNQFAAGVMVAPAFLQRMAREVTAMHHTKMLAAGFLVAGALGLWLGSFALPSADGQQSTDPLGRGVTRFASESEAPQSAKPSSWRYKYVPLDEGQTADTLTSTAQHLETEAAQGWEFCGSLDMALKPNEYQALKAGKQPPTAGAGSGRASLYRVLVFKRRAAEPLPYQVPVQRDPLSNLMGGKTEATARVPLHNLDAQGTASLMRQLLQDTDGGRVRPHNIQVDRRANAIIVISDPETVALVERLLKGVDALQPKTHEHKLPVETLLREYYRSLQKIEVATPNEPLKQPLMESRQQTIRIPIEGKYLPEVTAKLSSLLEKSSALILPEVATNSLLVMADAATIGQIRQLLELAEGLPGQKRSRLALSGKLAEAWDREKTSALTEEKPAPPRTTELHVRVYRLQRATTSGMSHILREMFTGQKEVQIQVTTDAATNALVITADKDTHARLAQIIASIEKEMEKEPKATK